LDQIPNELFLFSFDTTWTLPSSHEPEHPNRTQQVGTANHTKKSYKPEFAEACLEQKRGWSTAYGA